MAIDDAQRPEPTLEVNMFDRSLGTLLALSLSTAVPQVAFARDYQSRHEHREEKTRNTLVGAGLGLLGGALLSNGDPWASLAGAAAGGAIGNVATGDRDRGRRWDSDRRWSGYGRRDGNWGRNGGWDHGYWRR